MSKDIPRTPQNNLRVPLNLPPEVLDVVNQIAKKLRNLDEQVGRVTQNVYIKGSTVPYFLPLDGEIGAVLVFTTTTNDTGETIPSAKWLAPGTAGQVLQSNGPGADPTWV